MVADLSLATLQKLDAEQADALVSLHRNGHTLVSRSHTQFHLGDKVTMVGPQEKLEEVLRRFDV